MNYTAEINCCRNCPFRQYVGGPDACWLDDEGEVEYQDIDNSNEQPPINCPLKKYETVTIKLQGK